MGVGKPVTGPLKKRPFLECMSDFWGVRFRDSHHFFDSTIASHKSKMTSGPRMRHVCYTFSLETMDFLEVMKLGKKVGSFHHVTNMLDDSLSLFVLGNIEEY